MKRQHWKMPAGGGSILDLKLQQGSIQPPGKGEVLVRVCSIGLNFADVFTSLGLYSPIRSGEIKGAICPGIEFAGVVEKVGGLKDERLKDSVNGDDQMVRGGQLVILSEETWNLAENEAQKFSEGDKVFGCMRFGSFATKVVVPAHQIRKLPKDWSFEQGASFTAQTLTAYYALRELGGISAGDKTKTVLIHSAAGGVGMQSIAICKALGITKIVGTVGSPAKIETLLKKFPFLQAEQIIVRAPSKVEFGNQLKKSLEFLDSTGFDCVLDAIMGYVFNPGFDSMNAGGRYVIFGAASFTPNSDSMGILEWLRLGYQYVFHRPMVDPMNLITVNKSLLGFNLIHTLNNAKVLMKLMDELEELNLNPPHVGKTWKFHQLIEALEDFRKGRTVGKVVVNI